MKNIFKFMAEYKLHIMAIILLLIVQAYCELALPEYTSDILNVGLQQGGLTESIPETIRQDSLWSMEMIMSDEAIEIAENSYGPADEAGVRTLNIDADIDELKSAILLPECVFYQVKTNRTYALIFKKINEAIEAGTITKEGLIEGVNNLFSSYEGLPEAYMSQVAIGFVSVEYAEQGIDMTAIRNSYLINVGLKMLAVTLVMSLAAILIGFIASIVSSRIARNLRERIFSKVLSFSNSEMEKFSTASLITRATNDIQQVQIVSVVLMRFVAYAPILAIGGILKVLDNKSGMGWIIVLAVIILMALVGVLTGIAIPKFKIMQSLVDDMNLVSREILTGIMPIRAFSREQHEEKRFDKANNNLFKTQLFTNRVMTFMMPLMMFVMNGISVLIVWVGAKKVDYGTIQIGDLTAFITYSMVIVMGFLIVTMVSILMPRAGVAADRIVEVIDTKCSINDPETTVTADSRRGEIIFEDVSFMYPGANEYALEHISFKASPGKVTAIIGSTGCGKTSLINLIPRFYDVTKGCVKLDGIDIRNISQAELRDVIGYVPQKGMLFSGTIESNIKYAGDEVTDSDMYEAAKISQAEDFIKSKADGYQSAIAQEGSNVSGGQRQRLSIARAIAKKPNVFIFDDSFSALDFKTDLALRTALSEKIKDAAIIIVAQRISTISHADQIIVLDDGKIAGMGTHEELLSSCETYQEIAKSQMSDAELGGAF